MLLGIIDKSLILSSVDIDNGAAIVTTKSVCYATYLSNPAKIIKYRFNSEKIIEIEGLRWWSWSLKKMKSNIELFNRN